MCGILGIFNRSPRSWSGLASTQVDRLHHRGPDGQGIHTEGQVSLGHTRLSILDLSDLGRQPMTSDSGRYTVTYNGEVYNYLELKAELEARGESFVSRCDTEVILAAYRCWGPSCVERFRGMFAMAIWDKRERTLFLARDRCGEKPLIYWMNGEQFIFASEFKALLPLLPNRPSLDPAVVDMYLHFQYVPEPRTLLQGVRKLPAAHHMTISPDSWDARPVRYWDLESIHARSGDPAGLIRDELDKAIKLTLRSDVPVGVALSGGIDSGAIATIASRHYPEPMHAFSVGYPGRPTYDEREQARELATKLGMIFHEVELPVDQFVDFFPKLVGIMDEPIADPAAFGHYAVPKAAADLGIKVLLTGIGGDEVFWGYSWVSHAVRVNQMRMALRRMPSFAHGLLEGASMSGMLRRIAGSGRVPTWARHIAGFLAEVGCRRTPAGQLAYMSAIDDFNYAFRVKPACYGPAMAGLSPDNPFAPTVGNPARSEDVPAVLLRILFETWLVSNCLNLGDRVSMAVGVETRLPFLDCGLIELVMGLRRSQPDHGLGHKAWLKQALQGTLSPEVLSRPKRGFQPPVHEWLLGVVRTYGDQLRGGRLTGEGILNARSVDATLTNPALHTWPDLFFAYKLVLLENWHRQLMPDPS
ncbi:MAG: asparagine synthase (glutamine-hydrolyzing) [Desulfomicrobium sp.]|nr:asparagine synthase (glutamine-hydrolyzing) [Desulfomicrobium sp.]